MKIVLAGGSGSLGCALVEHFQKNGHDVVILTRSARQAFPGVREVLWNGRSFGNWMRELEGASAVINLAGHSVNCRYNRLNRRKILESRVLSTWVLGAAISQCQQPPCVWLNSSTATIYKHTFGPAWDEGGEIGGTREANDEFSVSVAVAWEQALQAAPTPQTRKVAMRAAMVLSKRKNSVYPVLRRLISWGLGGKMGTGRQYVSWIYERDFCRAIDWLIAHAELSGAVNLSSSNPVTNTAMMRMFRDGGNPCMSLPATKRMLAIGAFFLRTETELILKSRRVVPKRLLDSGFAFEFPSFESALEELQTKKEA